MCFELVSRPGRSLSDYSLDLWLVCPPVLSSHFNNRCEASRIPKDSIWHRQSSDRTQCSLTIILWLAVCALWWIRTLLTREIFRQALSFPFHIKLFYFPSCPHTAAGNEFLSPSRLDWLEISRGWIHNRWPLSAFVIKISSVTCEFSIFFFMNRRWFKVRGRHFSHLWVSFFR